MAPGAAGRLDLGPGVVARVFGHADRPRVVRIGARLDGGNGRLVVVDVVIVVITAEVRLAA